MEESQCRLDDGTGTGIVVEDVKTMHTGGMIHKRDRDVALASNGDKLVDGLVEESSIQPSLCHKEWRNLRWVLLAEMVGWRKFSHQWHLLLAVGKIRAVQQ